MVGNTNLGVDTGAELSYIDTIDYLTEDELQASLEDFLYGFKLELLEREG